MGAVEFMADIARPFRVASMLSKDRSGEATLSVPGTFPSVGCVVCPSAWQVRKE